MHVRQLKIEEKKTSFDECGGKCVEMFLSLKNSSVAQQLQISCLLVKIVFLDNVCDWFARDFFIKKADTFLWITQKLYEEERELHPLHKFEEEETNAKTSNEY